MRNYFPSSVVYLLPGRGGEGGAAQSLSSVSPQPWRESHHDLLLVTSHVLRVLLHFTHLHLLPLLEPLPLQLPLGTGVWGAARLLAESQLQLLQVCGGEAGEAQHGGGGRSLVPQLLSDQHQPGVAGGLLGEGALGHRGHQPGQVGQRPESGVGRAAQDQVLELRALGGRGRD